MNRLYDSRIKQILSSTCVRDCRGQEIKRGAHRKNPFHPGWKVGQRRKGRGRQKEVSEIQMVLNVCKEKTEKGKFERIKRFVSKVSCLISSGNSQASSVLKTATK